MITVVGMWEESWMDHERTERRIWKQTIQAYGVDRWIMLPKPRNRAEFTSPEQFDSMEEALDTIQSTRVFLVPPKAAKGVPAFLTLGLSVYQHPLNVAYIFGNTVDNLSKYIKTSDDVVSILTPKKVDMFAHVALGQVLYDRMLKA